MDDELEPRLDDAQQTSQTLHIHFRRNKEGLRTVHGGKRKISRDAAGGIQHDSAAV